MQNNSIVYSQLGSFLHTSGFICEFDKELPDFDRKAGLYAYRKGRSIKIFPFGDYIFVHIGSFSGTPTNQLNEKHQQARNYVNSLYKWPRAMRWSVPNIATIFISKDGFTDEMKKLARKRTRSIIGGEIHGMYLVDLVAFEFVSQGINYTFVPLPVGTHMEFKGVDPQNRMFYLIQTLSELIFMNVGEIE